MSFDLLLEVGTEEIPAGFVPAALADLERIASASLAENNIEHGEVRVFGTPRRMVLSIGQVTSRQPDIVEEAVGPSVTVAFDGEGNPTKAGMGFARSKGVEPSELLKVETDKGVYVAVRRTIIGRETTEVLGELIPAWLGKIPFKKSMRWGSGELAFARPIHWILALAGEAVIPFSFGGIEAGNESRGHRFHAPESFSVGGAADYFAKLEKAFVIVDPEKRKAMIRQQVAEEASKLGLTVIADEELLDTITYLVEYPVAVAGTFEAHYLELPGELLILTMKTHQKYFAVVDDEGKLANHFITVSNTRAKDMSVVARGNERVLRARLADARFFFDEDQKKTLEAHAEGLKSVVFQRKLGTSFEKVERFRGVAKALAEKLCPSQLAVVDEIARLCKADLVTMMVYEFPEIQGIVGREYALRGGKSELVAKSIQQHYWPAQAGGELPETVEADCVSLGDKLDTVAGCFGVGLIPTGAADPYALRRQTLGILRILLEKNYRLDLSWLVDTAIVGLADKLTRPADEVRAGILDFFRGRIETLLSSKGYSGDVIGAVVGAGFDDVVDLVARAEAIQSVGKADELATLAGTFKRAANILKGQETTGAVDPALFAEPAETELWAVYGEVSAAMKAAVGAGDYLAFFQQAAKLKIVVDGFFDNVMVMCEDAKVKANRVALMGAVTALFGRVADFTKITT